MPASEVEASGVVGAEEENTLQSLARNNPKMHKVMLDDWGYRKALDIAGIDYGVKPPDHQ